MRYALSAAPRSHSIHIPNERPASPSPVLFIADSRNFDPEFGRSIIPRKFSARNFRLQPINRATVNRSAVRFNYRPPRLHRADLRTHNATARRESSRRIFQAIRASDFRLARLIEAEARLGRDTGTERGSTRDLESTAEIYRLAGDGARIYGPTLNVTGRVRWDKSFQLDYLNGHWRGQRHHGVGVRPPRHSSNDRRVATARNKSDWRRLDVSPASGL